MRKTNSIKNFRMYCNSYEGPEYIKRYIFRMNEEEFYNFFKEVNRAASYLIDEDYLLYKLFWILKYNFTDLSKELCIMLNMKIFCLIVHIPTLIL